MYWHVWMYILPFMTGACDLNRCFSNEFPPTCIKNHKIAKHTIRNVGNASNIAFPRLQKMPTSKTMMLHQVLRDICFPNQAGNEKWQNRHCNSILVSYSFCSWLLLVKFSIMDVYLDCFPGLYLGRNETKVIFSPTKLCFTTGMGMKASNTYEIWSVQTYKTH